MDNTINFYKKIQRVQLAIRGTFEIDKQGARAKYSSLQTIYNGVYPVLEEYRLMVKSRTDFHKELGIHIMITTLVDLDSGEDIVDVQPIINEKGDNQGSAGSQTYAKRCALKNLLGFHTGEDDDGDAGAKAQAERIYINSHQISNLHNALRNTNSPDTVQDQLLDLLRVTKVDNIKVDDYQKAMKIVNELNKI